MIIKSIYLKNIRSYIEQQIDFSEGVSLLAGDIGAGKSTVLLAIDFALFGLQRGELSGSTLLRNGAEFGVVTLEFYVSDNLYKIQRVLKKAGSSEDSGIVQDSGFLSINGDVVKGTAVELKQKIIEILNYPSEVLSKKSLIYRYTVYTPQEEMKTILLGDVESRLGTLRKLFNIDKYKRIGDNSRIIVAKLKEKRKEIAARIYDLEDKKIKLSENILKLQELEPQVNDAEIVLKGFISQLEEKKGKLAVYEEKIKKLNELKKNKEVYNSELKSKNDFVLRLKNELEGLIKEFENIPEIIVENSTEILEKIKTIENSLKFSEQELNLSRRIAIENETRKKHQEHLSNSIISLENCPTCKQKVSVEHKIAIEKDSLVEFERFDEEILKAREKEKEIELVINKMRKELDIFKSKLKEIDFKKIQLQEFEKKKSRRLGIEQEINVHEKRLVELSDLRFKIDSELQEIIDIEQQFFEAKSDFELFRKQMQDAEISVVAIKKDVEFLNKETTSLKGDIAVKEKMRERLEELGKLSWFLDNQFLQMIEMMERKVMLRVHSEFNSLFSKWLGTLLNSEITTSALNEEFTPVIRQNGYDIDYSNLSGGEKTACALAYRLALNQVVNSIDSSINTKDLIILDEPTDGFSPEQLEIMKEVLNQLKIKQIIIVSHEPKIESFASHIIRVEKSEHVSKISNV